jgi:hypothetical protein
VLWISYVKDGQFAPILTLESILVENDISVDSEFLERVWDHLKIVKQKFDTYLQNTFYEKFLWVRDPFQANNHKNYLSLLKKEQLIELSSDSGLELQFHDLHLLRFWISPSVRSEFPELIFRSIENCHAVFNNLFL